MGNSERIKTLYAINYSSLVSKIISKKQNDDTGVLQDNILSICLSCTGVYHAGGMVLPIVLNRQDSLKDTQSLIPYSGYTASLIQFTLCKLSKTHISVSTGVCDTDFHMSLYR
jgi:hypothetical protein